MCAPWVFAEIIRGITVKIVRMTSRFDGYNWIVRLSKGELLMESLDSFIKEHNIAGGWVNGLGAAVWAELGFYDLHAQQYNFKKLDQLLEITSLQGNIAWVDNKPFVHLHGTFSNAEMQGLGGHVKELEVGGTCEIYIHTWEGEPIARVLDAETGLPLLDL
ncbi:MAG: protein of unknown function superfamily protein [Candidatus Saccharibacteria bacterium]|nr:protein of unknown function superfamily protein [Candidatus Saccharibacteria bacterium]